jgi:DNA-binding LacI/PurR family transcriptional regulator
MSKHDHKQDEAAAGPVTLQTIADRLGVSRTTVSNAYGRPDQLNPALRRKILDAAAELGYCGPNPAARSLRRGKSDALGLMFTESLSYAVTDPVAVLFLRGIAEATDPAGTALLLLPFLPGRSGAADPVRAAVVDGFIVYAVAEDDARLAAVLARRLPTVLVDQVPAAAGGDAVPGAAGAARVAIDDRAAGRLAADHLLALGHRRLGVVTFPLADDGFAGFADPARQAAATYGLSRARLGGYADAVRAAGLPWESVPVREAPLNDAALGRAAAADVLDREPRPTALLCFSDLLALGALEAAAERGLRVPGDLSVVGFDDAPFAATAAPPLTTVRQPLVEKGRVAARLLLDGWPADDPPALLLPTELVVRESTAPP